MIWCSLSAGQAITLWSVTKDQTAMKLTVQTKKATKRVIVAKKAKTVKTSSILSQQWKALKRAGVDKSLGHGGIYNIRAVDITGNLLVERAKGASTRSVRIIKGKHGLCFLDGAFCGDVLNVGNYGIDTAKIKAANVLYKGSLQGAIDFVRKHGKDNAGVCKDGSKFTSLWDVGGQYAVGTDGKRLVRTESRKTTEGSARFQYVLK